MFLLPCCLVSGRHSGNVSRYRLGKRSQETAGQDYDGHNKMSPLSDVRVSPAVRNQTARVWPGGVHDTAEMEPHLKGQHVEG